MENVRKQDPTFTNFVPRNAAEAVDRYVRCRRNGLKPMLVPECLIECAKGLDAKQLDMFENWIINPNGSLDNIAGVLNRDKNVLGMMPHPERLSEDALGGTDGQAMFRSLVAAFV